MCESIDPPFSTLSTRHILKGHKVTLAPVRKATPLGQTEGPTTIAQMPTPATLTLPLGPVGGASQPLRIRLL